jgi:ethanolamine ammonia-lyase large subunit
MKNLYEIQEMKLELLDSIRNADNGLHIMSRDDIEAKQSVIQSHIASRLERVEKELLLDEMELEHLQEDLVCMEDDANSVQDDVDRNSGMEYEEILYLTEEIEYMENIICDKESEKAGLKLLQRREK